MNNETHTHGFTLLPCPCGNKNIAIYDDEDGWAVECNDDECRWMTYGLTAHSAVEAWQKREVPKTKSEGQI